MYRKRSLRAILLFFIFAIPSIAHGIIPYDRHNKETYEKIHYPSAVLTATLVTAIAIYTYIHRNAPPAWLSKPYYTPPKNNPSHKQPTQTAYASTKAEIEVVPTSCPKQHNNYTCGLYSAAIAVAALRANKAPTFAQMQQAVSDIRIAYPNVRPRGMYIYETAQAAESIYGPESRARIFYCNGKRAQPKIKNVCTNNADIDICNINQEQLNPEALKDFIRGTKPILCINQIVFPTPGLGHMFSTSLINPTPYEPQNKKYKLLVMDPSGHSALLSRDPAVTKCVSYIQQEIDKIRI